MFELLAPADIPCDEPPEFSEPLQVTYSVPGGVTQHITEDVYTDPQDPWHAGSGSILVSAKRYKALQGQLTQMHDWYKNINAMTDTARHDYLREHEYLMDHLRTLRAIAASISNRDETDDGTATGTAEPTSPGGRRASASHDSLPSASAAAQLMKGIQEVLGTADENRGKCQEDPASVVDSEEVQQIAEAVGPKDDSDNELIEKLAAMGIDTSDEVTVRLLLKDMRPALTELIQERGRLSKVVNALEGGGSGGDVDPVGAVIAAAEQEKAPLLDVIGALLEWVALFQSNDTKEGLIDAISNDVRSEYEAALKDKAAMEALFGPFNEKLARHEQQEARVWQLREEVSEMEQAVKDKEIADEKIRTGKNERIILTVDVLAALTPEERARLEAMEAKVEEDQKESRLLKTYVGRFESKVEDFEEKEAKAYQRLKDMESEEELAEQNEAALQTEIEQELEAEKLANEELTAIRKQREFLEDEQSAAKSPPPKAKDLRKIEAEVAEAKERNEELRIQEQLVFEREEMYEKRYEKTELQYKAYEEEEAARALMLKQEQEEANRADGKGQGPAETDPLLMEYYKRIELPDYANQTRFQNLYSDTRARAKQQQLASFDAYIQGEGLIVNRQYARGPHVQPSNLGANNTAPVHFRRPEDLRVRLTNAELSVEDLYANLDRQRLLTETLSHELKQAGKQFEDAAAKSKRLHEEVSSNLGSNMALIRNGVAEGDASSALVAELSNALMQHSVCIAEASEVWQFAEKACVRGASEQDFSLEAEACAEREKTLATATRDLYTKAAQAAQDGTAPLSEHAKRCCSEMETMEPHLAAAGAARGAAWPSMIRTATFLGQDKALEDALSALVREEELRQALLEAEIRAPPEAKRALAAVRSALTQGDSIRPQVSPEPEPGMPRRTLLQDDPLNLQL